MLNNNYIKRAAAAVVAAIVLLCQGMVFSEGGTGAVINISTPDEFAALTKNCTYDSYSKDMQVTLLQNIDMSETEFEPMKIFCGTFNGNGFSITGIKLNMEGSQKAVCFELGEGGEIRDLNISGSIKASSTDSASASLGEIIGNVAENAGINTINSQDNGAVTLGGLVGKNKGKIVNCAFDGVVEGSSVVGGIAGENADGGVIEACLNAGTVSGKSNVGGIAGSNSGVIKKSVNTGGVNYDPVEDSHNVGGICGSNSGVVSGCDNRGVVGYKNVGSNVGGIAGNQSGCITSSRNSGSIFGEKSVGGIFGRFEPYTSIGIEDLQRVKDDLNEFRNQVSGDVNQIIDNASGSADALRENINSDINGILDRVSGIESPLTNFNNRMNNLNDGILNAISSTTESINDSLNQVADSGSSLLDSLNGGTRTDIDDAVSRINGMTDNISRNAETMNTLIGDIDGMVNDINTAYNNGDFDAVDDGLNRLDERLDYMQEFVIDPASSSVNNALNSITRATDALRNSTSAAARAIAGPFEQAEDTLYNFQQDINSVKSSINETKQKIRNVRDKIKNLPRTTFRPGNLLGAARDLVFMTVYAEDTINLTDDQLKSELKQINSVDVDLPRDVSGESADNALVIYCLSSGAISGQTAVGGIGGTIGIESAVKNGDNITLSNGGIITDSSYVKAVIDGCVSEGEINSKNDYAGGIVGDAAMGIIKNTVSKANANSESGGMVGGIAGFSGGSIYDCAAISDLSGSKFIGGIAGSGKTIARCYALPRIYGTTEKIGAVAGEADGTVIDNYFIKENLSGIDSTDYEGKAVALLPGEITGTDTLPPRMTGFTDDKWYMGSGDIYLPQNRTLSDNGDSDIGALLKAKSEDFALFKFDVKFVVDGNTLYETTVNYGDTLDQSVVPELEYRDGYCPGWSADTEEPIIRDTVFSAEYVDAVKTIATSEDPPLLLVEGNFRDNASVTASETDVHGTFPNSCEPVAAYEFDISPDYSGVMKVHIRDKDGRGNCVAIIKDGKTEIVKAERDGSYLIFETDREGAFTVLHKPDYRWIIAGIIAAAVFALAAIVLIARRRRKANVDNK